MLIRLPLLFAILSCSASTAFTQDIWNQVYPKPVNLYYAASADSVYVIDGSELLLTTDACVTWEHIGIVPWLKDSLIGDQRLNYVFEDLIFVSPKVALLSVYSYLSALDGTPLTDPAGKLFISRNGGLNWDTAHFSFQDKNGPTTPIEKFERMSNGVVFAFGGSRPSLVESGRALGHTCLIFKDDTVKRYPVPSGILPAAAAAVLNEDMIFIGNGKAMIGTYLDSKFRTTVGIKPPVVYIKKGWIETSQHRSTDNGITWDSLFSNVTELYGSSFGVGWGNDERWEWMKINRYLGWALVQGHPSLYKITSLDTSIAYALTNRKGYLQRTTSGGFEARVANEGLAGTAIFPNPARDFVSSFNAIQWMDLLGRQYSPPFEMIGDRFRYDVRGLNAGTFVVRQGENSQVVIVQR